MIKTTQCIRYKSKRSKEIENYSVFIASRHIHSKAVASPHIDMTYVIPIEVPIR